MKIYTEEELLTDIRKQHEENLPETGEILQGMGFAVLSAIEHLKAAQLLFEKDFAAAGYNEYILATEELGKFLMFSQLIVIWSEPEKALQMKDDILKHKIKLRSAATILNKLLANSVSKIEKEVDGELFTAEIITKIHPHEAVTLHQTRMELCYTGFDGKVVSSPHHSINKIDPFKYLGTAIVLHTMFEKLWEVFGSIASPFFDLIEKCYKETDEQKIVEQKKEINRITGRIMPAFRKYMNDTLQEIAGIGIDELVTMDVTEFFKQHPEEFTKEKLITHGKNLKELILNNVEIEEIFIYPPLKDTAKSFYQAYAKTL